MEENSTKIKKKKSTWKYIKNLFSAKKSKDSSKKEIKIVENCKNKLNFEKNLDYHINGNETNEIDQSLYLISDSSISKSCIINSIPLLTPNKNFIPNFKKTNYSLLNSENLNRIVEYLDFKSLIMLRTVFRNIRLNWKFDKILKKKIEKYIITVDYFNE